MVEKHKQNYRYYLDNIKEDILKYKTKTPWETVDEEFVIENNQLIWQRIITYNTDIILKTSIYIENGQIKKDEKLIKDEKSNETNNITTFFAFLKEKYQETVSFLTHILSTTILMINRTWSANVVSIVARTFGAIIPNFVTPKLSKHAENKTAKTGVKIVELITIIFNTIETICFNWDKLTPKEQAQFITNPLENLHLIFCNEIFFNQISKYFTIEQIASIIATFLNTINIWTKIDGPSINLINNTQTLVRMLLVTVGFAAVTHLKTLDNTTPTSSIIAFQMACGGTYIALFNTAKNIWNITTNKEANNYLKLASELNQLRTYLNVEAEFEKLSLDDIYKQHIEKIQEQFIANENKPLTTSTPLINNNYGTTATTINFDTISINSFNDNIKIDNIKSESKKCIIS